MITPDKNSLTLEVTEKESLLILKNIAATKSQRVHHTYIDVEVYPCGKAGKEEPRYSTCTEHGHLTCEPL